MGIFIGDFNRDDNIILEAEILPIMWISHEKSDRYVFFSYFYENQEFLGL